MANGPLAFDCIGTNAGERELLRFFYVLKIGLVNSASLLREVLCNMSAAIPQTDYTRRSTKSVLFETCAFTHSE